MRADVAPSLVHDGLAIYDTGRGQPVLLMPSPHGFVLGPAVAGPLHEVLIGVGCRVVTFDPPGAFGSSRPPILTLQEMTRCAVEALDAVGASEPVHVVAHSHATLCSMGLALQHAERVDRLLLIGAVAGGQSAAPTGGCPSRSRPWTCASGGSRRWARVWLFAAIWRRTAGC
jgi:proline iminopeptidase